MKFIIPAIILIGALTLGPLASAESPSKFNKCQTCHGKLLQGKKKNPRIAGLVYEDVYASLTTNVPKKMKRVVAKLTDQEKIALARYISELNRVQ